MRISLLLVVLMLFLTAGAIGQEKSTGDVSADAPGENQEQRVETKDIPSQFVPKEKISPDQVISFPADI